MSYFQPSGMNRYKQFLKKPVNKAVNQTDNDILIFSLRNYVPPVV
jgi:hypothetical protein